MEVKKCSYCNEQVLPGLDYIINFNRAVNTLIATKNRLLPREAPSRLKFDGIEKFYSYEIKDYRTREVFEEGILPEFAYRRDMEYLSKRLSIKSIKGPLCEACYGQFLSEIKNVLIGFSPKLGLRDATKPKIERTVSSYNRKIAKLYKRWVKK